LRLAEREDVQPGGRLGDLGDPFRVPREISGPDRRDLLSAGGHGAISAVSRTPDQTTGRGPRTTSGCDGRVMVWTSKRYAPSWPSPRPVSSRLRPTISGSLSRRSPRGSWAWRRASVYRFSCGPRAGHG